MKQIYLDYNASTPIAPEVADAMRPFLSQHYGNPSSPHWAGAPARQAIEKARSQVASLLGCSPVEIIFTSGGTEANNHAIKGAYSALPMTCRPCSAKPLGSCAPTVTCWLATFLPIHPGAEIIGGRKRPGIPSIVMLTSL